MDMGETYGFTGRDGKRYEFSTYPAYDNNWAEGRVEINGEVARVVTSTWYRRATPTPTPAAGVLAELIEAEEIEERGLMQELRELVNTAEWELEEMLEQRREVASREREGHEEAPVCLACHQEIQGRHVIAWETTHFCTRCGSQLVRVGLAKYTTDRRTACQH